MIKIQPLRRRHMNQVRILLGGGALIGPDPVSQKAVAILSGGTTNVCFGQWMSRFLSVQERRNTMYYVAVDADKVLGLIGLTQDGFGNRRWWLSPVVIDPSESTYDIGNQLVHYVVNLYGGDGVQSFVAPALAEDSITQGVLKAAGFRSCTRLWQFHLESITKAKDYLDSAPKPQCRLVEARSHHMYAVSQVYNDALSPVVRVSLGRCPKDFELPWLARFNRWVSGQFSKGWVWIDPARDTIFGYVAITSTNFIDYTLLVVTSPGRTDGYDDLVRFGLNQIRNSSQSARVHAVAMDNQEEWQTALTHACFEPVPPQHLLVKDYWVPLSPAATILKNPLLLLDGGKASPA